MTSRARRHKLTGLAAVAMLVVSGCTFHPGSAAVVNGTKISQNDVDNLVSAACNYSKLIRLKGAGSTAATSIAYLKHFFTSEMVMIRITDKAAAQRGLTVSPAAIAKVTSGQTLPGGLTSSERAALSSYFTASAREKLQEAVIGAHLKDSSVTNADKVTQADLKAGTAYLKTYSTKQSVQINPAYGSWNGSTVVDTDGSLSAPKSSAAVAWLRQQQKGVSDVAGLPANQVCG